jgi:hypothetical protein
MKFEIISQITQVEIIAKGKGVDIRHRLNQEFGYANWRKLKGIAEIEYENGEFWLAEVHWYEAHTKGRKKEKDKRKIRRLG